MNLIGCIHVDEFRQMTASGSHNLLL